MVLRILFLTLTLLALVWTLQNTNVIGIPVIFLLIAIWQVISLVRFVDYTNTELARFFEAIRYSDFTRNMTPRLKGAGFRELNTALNGVVAQIKQNREEKEEQYRYLQTIVQHIGIGLIVFDDTGKVDLVNNAARRILNMSNIRSIEKLKSFDTGLADRITSLSHGERAILKIRVNDELQQMMIFVTDFVMRHRNFRLISFQNIQSELEEKELEAWQSLIRVLTHEIMNSITPISSLASTANSLLNNRAEKEPAETDETLTDVGHAVQTIENRSKGLLNFVENYRKLTKIPKPNYKILPISGLFNTAQLLFKAEMESRNITCEVNIDPDQLEITADPDLIEQVLINLVKNAIEAVNSSPNGQLRLSAYLDRYGKPCLEIADNGPGINKDVIDNIFIPFFTTKASGSGIGLSLSRQIMRVHGGSITARSGNRETVFTLRFK